MALITLRQLLDHAAENSYGLPAFNVNNMEQVQAIMHAADATNSPVILQGSAGARQYAGEPFLRRFFFFLFWPHWKPTRTSPCACTKTTAHRPACVSAPSSRASAR